MLVCVLGTVRLQQGEAAVAVRGRQQRRILSRLALGVGRSVLFDALEDAAWPDWRPATARHSIATHVLRLRRAGVEITTVPNGYRLETLSDAIEFERLAGEGAAAASSRSSSVACWKSALGLWMGSPFDDLGHVAEAAIESARLQELARGIQEQLLAAELELGDEADLVAGARRLVAEQPYRERRWELLMLSLYRSGRQAEALDAYSEARRTLIDDLGLEPGTDLRRIQQAVLSQDPALDANNHRLETRATASAGVPWTATRLIGRQQERADLVGAWDRSRLATLLGPPGAGKTRLAVDAAGAATGQVWFVELEQISSGRTIAAAILEVVSPSSRSADPHIGLVDALNDASGLIVLDGCEERRADVADELRRLLPHCPAIRILATSRERLGVFDEAVVPVGPLDVDDAIELLVDRARMANPRFQLAPTERDAAQSLCAVVDRLPLAIELVARHLHLLRVDEVAERVVADMGRWAGQPVDGRPGLWAALAASVQRLGRRQRRVLEALSVMVADADVDLIDQVAEGNGNAHETFDAVSRLVDASLVQVRSAPDSTRYELLKTVAVYVADTAEGDSLGAARRRYVDVVVERAERLAARLTSAERPRTLRILDREMPHIRSALTQLSEPGVGVEATRAGLRTAVAMSDYWLGRQPAEGVSWLTRFLADPLTPVELRAEAMLRASHLSYWLTDFSEGAVYAEQARAAFARFGDALGEGRALRRLGAIAAATDDLSSARLHLERSLARLEIAGVVAESGTTLLHLGSLLADEGSADAAAAALERSLAIARDTGDPLAQGLALAALTLAYWKSSELQAAVRSGEAALNVFRELGHRPTEGTVAYRLAAVTRGLGRPRAARRYGELAIEAGEAASTRTTTALGHINLARLDLDVADQDAAAGHLLVALEIIDPPADRWVLVEALEAVARLPVELTGAQRLLSAAAAMRAEIGQPVAPTERDDLEACRQRVRAAGGVVEEPATQSEAVEPRAVRDAALSLIGSVAVTHHQPTRARGRRPR